MRRSIATVCLSGTLEEKLSAAAEAGFDGVEIFEPDLVVSDSSPEEIRAMADRLGIRLDLYQPFRDFEGVTPDLLEDNLRRARDRFEIMERLGIDTILVCSNVATASIDSDSVSAEQLRRLGDLAATYGIRIAFEALAWGAYVDDYRRAWRIVELADHEAVGVCLDSFHILSRNHDPSTIEEIPGDKIFFVQLADAPALSMDVLSWSRHYRLFPGEGAFDLVGFVGHLTRADYRGPLSLEVFNDTFRQTDTRRTAEHAMRSLVWLEDQAARLLRDEPRLSKIAEVDAPSGYDYVEIKAEDTSSAEMLLDQLGFVFRGRHRTKPVRLWSSGQARIVLSEQHARGHEPHVAGAGFHVADAEAASDRARSLAVRPVPRRTHAGEQRLSGFVAPSGLEVFVNDRPSGDDPSWIDEFEQGHPAEDGGVTAIDHINLVHGWEDHDEAVLFYTSVLGLEAPSATQVASPQGLVRSQVMRNAAGSVRIPMNVAPLGQSRYPEHVALLCDDAAGIARRARENGLRPLPIPANYYDDLRARFGLDESVLETLRANDLLYDRDQNGEFRHFYTPRIGRVFFEVIERRGSYDGYGAANAPVRLAAQARVDARSVDAAGPRT